MARTSSILDDDQLRGWYGDLLAEIADHQAVSSIEVAKVLDDLPDSTGRRRLSDWSRYTRGQRLPTQKQVKLLARALCVPFQLLRLCSGYIDETFECCYAAATQDDFSGWEWSIRPRRAALALLFSLFPDSRMHIDNRLTLAGLLDGTTVLLNMYKGRGYETGEGANATWLYPAILLPTDLITSEFDAGVTYVSPPTADEPWFKKLEETDFEPSVSVRAEAQIDVASPIAETLLSQPAGTIPPSSLLHEAQRILHNGALELRLRLALATSAIHIWADDLDEELSSEVREHLQQWPERTLTAEATRWIRGQRSDPPLNIWL